MKQPLSGGPAQCPACHLVAGLFLLTAVAARALDPGAISVAPVVSNSLIQVTLTPPANAFWVKLSQDPAFKETTNGIAIQIVSIDPDGSFTDLNIIGPGGATNSVPESEPGLGSGSNEVSILVLPARFSDGGAPPAYATSNWFYRLMFSTNAGPDARSVPNSARMWMEQNTYGHVLLTGGVFPGWVTLHSAEYYNNLPYGIEPAMVADALAAARATNRAFFAGKHFDFAVVLTPGDFYAVDFKPYGPVSMWNDPNGLVGGYLLMDLPIGPESIYCNTITNEARISQDATSVLTRLDTTGVVYGVWLATDPGHTGTNYYTGGGAGYHDRTIQLGTPLPGTQVAVLVSYVPMVAFEIPDPNAPLFSSYYSGVWYGTFLHELSHGLGPHISLVEGMNLGDLYQAPAELIRVYGLMAGGHYNCRYTDNPPYVEPCHYDGYTKYRLGFLQPYTLAWGQGALNLRLYATEESPCSPRTKLVKIPLQPRPEAGRQRLYSYTGSPDYRGEEYLLLEWRQTNAVPGIHNFDTALPDQGLLIYHVIEANPMAHGGDWYNTVRIIDATPVWDSFNPPRIGEQLSVDVGACFGPASGQWSYVHGENWQEVVGTNYPFRLHGAGSQTVYAKFKDPAGHESVPVSATTTVLTQPEISIADAAIAEGNSGSTNVSVRLSLSESATQTVAVAYVTADGTATNGTDYVAASGVATFAPGATNAGISIAIAGDLAVELDKMFYVRLSQPTNAILARNQAAVTIHNDDFLAGAVDHFEWTLLPGTIEAGQPVWVTIEARDGLGRTVTNWNGTFSLSAEVLTTDRTVEVLCFTGFAGDWSGLRLAAISNTFTGFHVTLTTDTEAAALAGDLAGKDVFLVPPQDDPGGVLWTLGFAWSAVLKDFVRSGGTIVVNPSASPSVVAVLSNAGLLAATWTDVEYNPELVAPLAHPLAEGVTALYENSWVATFKAPDSVVALQSLATGEPVVACKEFGAGRIVLIGYGLMHDVYPADGGPTLLLPGFLDPVTANAVKGAQKDKVLATPIAVAPAGPFRFTNGIWSGAVTVVQTADRLRFVVTDDAGHAGASAALAAVNPLCRIVDIARDSNRVVLTFTSRTNGYYRVEYADDLRSDTWHPVEERPGTGELIQVTHLEPLAGQRFYRVGVQPR